MLGKSTCQKPMRSESGPEDAREDRETTDSLLRLSVAKHPVCLNGAIDIVTGGGGGFDGLPLIIGNVRQI